MHLLTYNFYNFALAWFLNWIFQLSMYKCRCFIPRRLMFFVRFYFVKLAVFLKFQNNSKWCFFFFRWIYPIHLCCILLFKTRVLNENQKLWNIERWNSIVEREKNLKKGFCFKLLPLVRQIELGCYTYGSVWTLNLYIISVTHLFQCSRQFKY